MTGPRQLVVNGRYLAGSGTAVNTVAAELTQALAHRVSHTPGFQLTVAVPPYLRDKAAETGLPFEVVGFGRGLFWEQVELPRFCRGKQLLGFFNSVPLIGRGHVTLLHDAHVFEIPSLVPRFVRLWRQLTSRAAGWPGRRILTVSEYSKQRLIDFGVGTARQISVIYNGVDHIDRVVPDPTILDRLEPDRPFFVALAGTWPHKNIGVLLKAMADPSLSEARLVLTGGHACAADFERIGQKVPDNVVFIGFVTMGELRSLYEAAAAVCMPSLIEGFGLPPLEAMYLGTPAIVANRTALPELCAEGAYYAEPDQPAAWVDRMSCLLEGRGSITLATRQAVAGRFTWDRAAERLLDSLSDLDGSESDLE